ncbi:hypothetical protein [Terasakiella pusilla]|uniref:hypothetical protein n=1 Tax=Terasakiella pusilla TaxID=64973 RepID=UPI003AA9ABC4
MPKHEMSDPNNFALYGAICGIKLPQPETEIAHGLILRETYAHVMSPYLVALSPITPMGIHGGPWKSVSGGIAFDAYAEIALAQYARPYDFDRLNTIWFILALLRLRHSVGIRVPVISNIAFQEIALVEEEPVFWPIEMASKGFCYDRYQKGENVSKEVLDWIARHSVHVSRLLTEHPHLLNAFRAYDGSHSASSINTAKMLLWSAVEALFRPGDRDIRKTLSKLIATFLHVPSPSRDSCFSKVSSLYQVRGQIAHAAEQANGRMLWETAQIVRECFVKVFEDGIVPDRQELLDQWKTGT